MTNKEITERFAIPQRTLSDWSRCTDETNWRFKLYKYLRGLVMTNEEYDDWEARNMGYRDAKHMREHNDKKAKARATK